MKKSRMERLHDPLFQPLRAEETTATMGGQVMTFHFSVLPTDGATPDHINDNS
ncbi:MAG TPA: hypothetical protein VGE98_01040 [Thermoanaerobaculia bacterium]